MATKEVEKRRKYRKTTRRRKTGYKISKRRITRGRYGKSGKRYCIRGGAYSDKDATITEIQDIPVKSLNSVVVTGPGFVLDGRDFLQREADRDRQGSEQTD